MKNILFAIAAVIGGGIPKEHYDEFKDQVHNRADKMARKKARKAYIVEYRKWL